MEEGVVLVRGEEAEIQLHAEITHGFVEESGMAGFIPCHVGKAFSQQGILLLDATAQFLVKKKTREFRRAALFQEFHKDPTGLGVKFVCSTVKVVVANEVMAVVILAEFLADGLQFCLIRTQIHGSHGIKVRGVKPRCEDRVLNRILRCNGVGFCDGSRRDHRLRFHVETNVGLTVRGSS